ELQVVDVVHDADDAGAAGQDDSGEEGDAVHAVEGRVEPASPHQEPQHHPEVDGPGAAHPPDGDAVAGLGAGLTAFPAGHEYYFGPAADEVAADLPGVGLCASGDALPRVAPVDHGDADAVEAGCRVQALVRYRGGPIVGCCRGCGPVRVVGGVETGGGGVLGDHVLFYFPRAVTRGNPDSRHGKNLFEFEE